jgi:Helix-turn-helix domain
VPAKSAIPTLSLEYLTVQECAAILKLSRDTIIRRFQNRRGVLVIGGPDNRSNRCYRTIRIPKEALDQFIAEVAQ